MISENIICQLNKETQEHSFRVADICKILSSELNLDSKLAYRMGLFHDIGKIYIPSNIMKKNIQLSKLEREIIDLHAYFGYRMLKDADEPSILYLPVLFHHGYWKPKLHTFEDECIDEYTVKYVCLLHSADVFDAMTSKRVYHRPFSIDEALEALSSDMISTEQIIEVLRKHYRKENNSKLTIISGTKLG